MSDLFDTEQVRDEVAYWDALAQRVSTEAERRSTAGRIDWLTQSRTSWVAASVLLAAALALMALPADRAPTTSMSADWARALAPTDAMGRTITMDDGPPEIGALLLGGKR